MRLYLCAMVKIWDLAFRWLLELEPVFEEQVGMVFMALCLIMRAPRHLWLDVFQAHPIGRDPIAVKVSESIVRHLWR